MKSFTSKLNPAQKINSLWQRNQYNFSSLIKERFDDEIKQKFINLTQDKTDDPYNDYMEIQEKSGKILKEIIPQNTKELLKEFGKKSRPLILLQNCPIIGINGLPLTPITSKKSEEKDHISEYFMLAIADLINASPYLIKNVRDGNIINQVIPIDPNSISGSGSKVPFNLHNEVVHESIVPDFFLLLCLRGNPFAKTNYCFIEDILKYLPPKIIEELQKPNFLMKSGDKSVFKEAKEFQCPILTKDELGSDEIRLNVAPNRCEGLTNEANFALNYIKHCLQTNIPIHDVTLSQGDTLLVNNKRTLHGRSSFDENYKSNSRDDKRWIQRINLIKNIGDKTI